MKQECSARSIFAQIFSCIRPLFSCIRPSNSGASWTRLWWQRFLSCRVDL